MPPQRIRQTVVALLAMLVLLGGQAVGRAADPATDKARSDEAVRVIRQRYEEINARDARYRKVRKDLAGFSAEGGVMVAYFDSDTLAKIEVTYYGESGQASEEYYYWDGQLIFILRADSRYGRLPSGQPSGKIVRTEKSRFYFKDNQLIVWLDEDGKAVSLKPEQYQAKGKERLQSSSDLSQGARSPEATIEATR